MPGRIMAGRENGAPLSNGVPNPSEHAQRSSGMLGGQKGDVQYLPNGNHAPHSTNTDGPVPALNGLMSIPPELVLSLEDQAALDGAYQPLSLLFQRCAQECMNDLDDTLTQMYEIGNAGAEGANGVVNGAGPQAIAVSVRKKRLLLDFANRQRERFIKLMVISQWSRKGLSDMKMLIKLKVWEDKRLQDVQDAAAALAELKYQLHWFKEPNPDIRTALEVLSTGSASWLPSFDFVPPKPVTAREMLKTLTDLNALISLRINLHEELPRHLKQWNVANGRATFTIPSEFEFDVTIADEDPSTPFYWLDVRFLFSPAPEIPDSALRVAMEDRANVVLRESGIGGCYELLHDLTLTHKISILRRQAYEMSRGAWNNSIRVETVHRSLIVQYWTGQASKSWLEIGVVGNKTKKRSWRGPEPSKLGLRWTRNGVEVPITNLELDWTALNMERMLQQIIARHVTFILESIAKALPQTSGGQQLKSLELQRSDTQASECVLKAEVHGQRSPVTLMQDAVTGRLVLHPPSPLAERAEADLNSQPRPEINAEQLLARFCAREMQHHTEHQAEILGWEILRSLKLENPVPAFPQPVISMSFYRGCHWVSASSVIASTYNLSGESWWVVELADPASGGSIVSVQPIQAEYHERMQDPFELAPLRRIEKLAVVIMSMSVIMKQLPKAGTGHQLRQENPGLGPFGEQLTPSTIPTSKLFTLFIQLAKLVPKAAAKSQLARQTIRFNVVGFAPRSGSVSYHIRGRLAASRIARSRAMFAPVKDQDLVVKRNGDFSLRVAAPFGESCLEPLMNRLLSLQQLHNLAAELRQSRVLVRSLQLKRITFKYPPSDLPDQQISDHPGTHANFLEAELSFLPGTNNAGGALVALAFPPANPHHRIQDLLSKLLNESDAGNPQPSFSSFLGHLRSTLPLLRAFNELEKRDLESALPASTSVFADVSIESRGLAVHRIDYRRRGVTLLVKSERFRDDYCWAINEAPPPGRRSSYQQQQTPPPPPRPPRGPALDEALRAAFASRGKDWRGVDSFIKADPPGGVFDALLRLDQIIRGEKVEPAGADGAEVVVASGAGSGQTAAKPPPQNRPEVITLD